MKTYLKALQLRGFKSFNRKVFIQFCPKMNVILGPNGSGKSNIGDAICFVLGRLSSKDLRAENFSDLLFKRKNTTAAEGEVSLILDNSQNLFPFKENEIEIKRKIKKTGQTQYYINGKSVTRQQVLELLALAKIFPDGYNIVLQGDIAKFVDLKPVEKRQLIEEIAGISTYEEKKAKALAELTKVDERLREVNIVLREKETYMKNLEAERKNAEKYKDLQNELKAAQAGELILKLEIAKSKKENCSKLIETKLIEIKNSHLDIEINNKKIIQLKEKLENLEKEIQRKGGEESLKLQKEVEAVRIELEKARELFSTTVNELNRLEKRRIDLEQNLLQIESKIKQAEDDKKKLKEKLDALENQIKNFKSEAIDIKSLEENLDELDKETSALQEKRNVLFERVIQLKTEKNTCEKELNEVEQKINILERNAKEFQETQTKLNSVLVKLESHSKSQTEVSIKIGQLKKEQICKESELTKIKALFNARQDFLQKDNSIKLLKNSNIKGIIGTVAELGTSKPEFSTALSVAAGNRLKNIVVDCPETALLCLEKLKTAKAGIATFLPLNNLKIPTFNIPQSVLKKQGVLGLAVDLIECEAKYKNLFSYVFRDTLIIKNSDIAKDLGFNKYRMVTLDGDLFEISGAITGGYRGNVTMTFDVSKNQIQELERDLEKLQKEIQNLEKQKAEIDSEVLKLQAQRIELEAKLKLTQNQAIKEHEALLERKNQIQKRLEALNSKLQTSEKEFSEAENKLKITQEKQNSLKTQLHNLKFETSMSLLEKLNQDKHQQISLLAALEATITNALLPEKNNVLRVLKELEKEKKNFDQQKVELERRISELEKELQKKESEQALFHGKLKQAFEEQAGLSTSLREAQTTLESVKLRLNALEQEKNNLTIEAAQYAAEISTLEDELKNYQNAEPLKFKTLEAAKTKIKELQSRLEALGPVNMRALEVFQDILKEYNDLSIKTTKLKEEKEAILQIIEEVEKKKKEAFMKTFNEINSKFEEIYKKINMKYIGTMILENVEKPFEGGLFVELKDDKKKRVSPAALSGGEKVLLALAFIFAIQEYEPAPFYLLDEIEAALDRVNSEQVAKLLKEYSKRSQIVIISHNDAVISEGDTLYGVSMTKEGESTVVSLKL
ncbi:MAG: chromosome segregation protein SMC [Candidatus Nanoarchaeia archaeon]